MPSYRHVFLSTKRAPDIMMIPALKELCDIPIIYDPSHSTGCRNYHNYNLGYINPQFRAKNPGENNGQFFPCPHKK